MKTKLSDCKMSDEQRIVVNYIEENASEMLINKINQGNKKMSDCWEYITKQAKAMARGKSSICISDAEVFGWAIHYFEEDSLKPDEQFEARAAKEAVIVDRSEAGPKQAPAKPKKEKAEEMLPGQMTILDFMGGAG